MKPGSDHAKRLNISKKSIKNGQIFILDLPFQVQNWRFKDFSEIGFNLKGYSGSQKAAFRKILETILGFFYYYRRRLLGSAPDSEGLSLTPVPSLL